MLPDETTPETLVLRWQTSHRWTDPVVTGWRLASPKSASHRRSFCNSRLVRCLINHLEDRHSTPVLFLIMIKLSRDFLAVNMSINANLILIFHWQLSFFRQFFVNFGQGIGARLGKRRHYWSKLIQQNLETICYGALVSEKNITGLESKSRALKLGRPIFRLFTNRDVVDRIKRVFQK